MRPIFTILLLLATTSSASGQQSVPKIDDLLSRVRENIVDYVSTLPGFSCDESVVSQRLDGQKIKDEMRIESSFRMAKSADSQSSNETRTVNLVNGRAPKGQKVAPPYSFNGGFANVLQFINDPCLHKSLDKPQSDGRLVLVGTSEEASTNSHNCTGSNREVYLTIDPDTFQVLRLELRVHDVAMKIPAIAHMLFIPMPSSHNLMRTLVTYVPITFGDKTFMLPHTVENTISDTTKPLSLRYYAQYSNCRRFAATVTVEPDSTPVPE
jgi:hypothetical protein